MLQKLSVFLALAGLVSGAVYQEEPLQLTPPLDFDGTLSDVIQPEPEIQLSRQARQACDVAPANLTAAYQQLFVDLHNSYRAGEEAPGMFTMRWDDDLAQRAQAWATKTIRSGSIGHGYLTFCNGTGFGQNIWWGSSSINSTSAVSGWFSEKQYYTRKTNICQTGKVCGHYTQVVWSNSYFLGCGSSTYNGVTIIVCNYYPPGNYAGVAPYLAKRPGILSCQTALSTPPQAKCGLAVNNKGLCDICYNGGAGGRCTCYPCQNGGTLDKNTCACACPTGFTGSLCQVNCRDTAGVSTCSQWGQYCSQSAYSAFMQNNCPCYCRNTVGVTSYTCCA